MSQEGDNNQGSQAAPAQQGEVAPWDPNTLLKTVSESHARYSKGFLRSKPAQWLQGYSSQWQPLFVSTGAEVRVKSVIPYLAPLPDLERLYVGSVNSDPLLIGLSDESASILINGVGASGGAASGDIVLEYLVRRFFGSLELSWSGPTPSQFSFEPKVSPSSVTPVGAIQVIFEVNGKDAELWLGLGSSVVDELDGLWRRQLHASAQQEFDSLAVHLEIAYLTVPPSMLGQYLQQGTMIDLEIGVSDDLTLIAGSNPWLAGKLRNARGNLAVEVTSAAEQAGPLPAGTLRMSIQFGSVTFDKFMVSEVAQVGAIYEAGAPISDKVNIVVNREVVGTGELKIYQGRLALLVL